MIVVVLPDITEAGKTLEEGEEDTLFRQCARYALLQMFDPLGTPDWLKELVNE